MHQASFLKALCQALVRSTTQREVARSGAGLPTLAMHERHASAIELGAGLGRVVATVEVHGGLAGRQGTLGEAVQSGRKQRQVVPIGRCLDNTEGNPCSVHENRALGSLLATIDRAPPGHLSAAGRLGDAAVHHDVIELQTDEPVVTILGDLGQLVHHPENDPLVAAAAQGGGRTAGVRDAPVGAAEYGDLDELVEDEAVGDPGAVAAQRVAPRACRQEGGELVPEGLDEA